MLLLAGCSGGGAPAAPGGATPGPVGSLAPSASPTPAPDAGVAARLAIATPAGPAVSGEPLALAVAVQDAQGRTAVGTPVWSVQNGTGTATITADGKLTGIKVGTVTATATLGGLSASAAIAVAAGPVRTAALSPAQATTLVGGTQQFTVAAQDAAGNPVPSPSASWSVANPALAGVSAAGLLTATGPGATRVQAALGALTAGANVTILTAASATLTLGFDQPLPGAVTRAVQVAPAAGAAEPPATLALTASAVDQAGAARADRYTWSVADTNVGHLVYTGTDATATFLPLGPAGSTAVTAYAANGVAGTANVTVRNVAPRLSNPSGPTAVVRGQAATFSIDVADPNNNLPMSSTNPGWNSNAPGQLSWQNQGNGGVLTGTAATGSSTLTFTPALLALPQNATITVTVSDGSLTATFDFPVQII